VDGAGVSLFDSVFDVAFVSDGASVAAAAVAAAGLAPPRKSVWYQPLPFSWKPGAVSFFWSEASPHAGQSVRTVADFLQRVELVPAASATVGVDRHASLRSSSRPVDGRAKSI
jgi:hypothetical protein